MQNHPKAFWAISAVIVIVVALITILILSQQQPKQTSKTKTREQTPSTKYYSPLTGIEVKNEADTKKTVTGVMIENSTDARPQSGLKNSGVVFEAIAEGGITRFLVLYQQEKPQTIGPVRSLRLYDIDWLDAFDASIAHVGGSAAALSEIRNGQHRDLDQFFNSGYYRRVSDRFAPHNVYTSFDKLDALNTAKGYTSSSFTGFKRADSKPVAKPDATNIDLTISGFLYNVTYTYDHKNNTYTRYEGGEPHIDREDGQIAPSVVIAMMVDETTVFEDGSRESIATIGNGDAYIFQNGTVIKATWHKATPQTQITFTDRNSDEIALSRGQTWITAVPNGSGGVEWK